MPELYTVGNPISREERSNLNATFTDIQRRFSIIQRDLGVLAGNQDVQTLINRIEMEITNAQTSTTNSNDALTRLDAQLTRLENELAILNNLRSLGEWDVATTYLRNNIITYNNNSYIAVEDNTGVTPGNTTQWQLVASQGVQGNTGAGLNVIGTLNSSDDLPSTGLRGDAYYIQGDLWVWATDQFINAGRIRGENGSDANVTRDNIISALGYTPANELDLNNFISQYEYQAPVVNGTQLTAIKQGNSNRLLLLIQNAITGGNITISIDGGATQLPLRNFDNTNVTSINPGYVEVVQNNDFFILRSSGSIDQSQLDRLIAVVNDTEQNNQNLRNQFSASVNRLDSSFNLGAMSTFNDILNALNSYDINRRRIRIGTATSNQIQQSFTNTSGSASSSFSVSVNDLDFQPRTVFMINSNYTAPIVVSLEFPLQNGFTYIRSGTSNFRLSGIASLNSTGFYLPAPSNDVQYNYIAIG